jgi:hypothetical protein
MNRPAGKVGCGMGRPEQEVVAGDQGPERPCRGARGERPQRGRANEMPRYSCSLSLQETCSGAGLMVSG